MKIYFNCHFFASFFQCLTCRALNQTKHQISTDMRICAHYARELERSTFSLGSNENAKHILFV